MSYCTGWSECRESIGACPSGLTPPAKPQANCLDRRNGDRDRLRIIAGQQPGLARGLTEFDRQDHAVGGDAAVAGNDAAGQKLAAVEGPAHHLPRRVRSEEHTSELQSLMRISYAVFCLKKK